MKTIILLLTITCSIFAQNQWSEPIQLSETAVYPDYIVQAPAISADKYNNLHAFWAKGFPIDYLTWYSQIEYRKSADNGQTWSETENITPEYTSERIFDIRVVFDSSNNLHLIYSRTSTTSEYSRIFHRFFDGEIWHGPYEVDKYYSNLLSVGIDNRDRLYILWFSGTTYYSFLDATSETREWSVPKPINYDIAYGTRSDLVFDNDNNLFCSGLDFDNYYYPYLYKYDPVTDTWDIENIIQQRSSASALVLSSEGNLVAKIKSGPSNTENQNFLTSKRLDSTEWSELVFLNENTRPDEKMFMDRYNRIHILENHHLTRDDLEILYTYTDGTLWKNESVQVTDKDYYFYFEDALLNDEDLFIMYRKKENSTNNGAIYFQHRALESGIECGYNNIEDFHLFQNYPNPFNPETEIKFVLNSDAMVNLSVYNNIGQLVETLISGNKPKGKYTAVFSSKDLNSGVYYYKLNADGRTQARKMLILK
jgi:hypothetical protein